jgi:predicted RNA methylase
MKLKNIISSLESLETFSSPKDYLEQYQTPPSIAGEMIHYISNNYSLNNYSIADLGCGTGILGISAALCGCKNVFLFDIDEEALDIAKNNIEQLELEDNIQIIQMDVNQLRQCNKLNKYFDLVITNPPFGIRSENGADIEFLKTASYICNNTIFSLHKFSTINFLKKFYNKNGINDIKSFKIEYNLPKTYKFQKKKEKNIDVVCFEAKINDIIIE